MIAASLCHNLIKKTKNTVCKLIGHNWRFKDYSNWMKENGDNYDFKASKSCSRCNQREYLYNEWKAERERSRYDVQRDVYSLKQMPLIGEH